MDKGLKEVLFDNSGKAHDVKPIKKLPENCIKFICGGCGKKILGDVRFQDICVCP